MRSSCYDLAAFFDAIGRDAGALASTLDLFRAEGRAQCARVASAARAHARPELREALHAFAGSLALVRAGPALELCECLREMSAEDDAALESVARDLEREFQRVCDELAPLVVELRQTVV